jgi:glycosyltransferase involved in cell wall biosynthesis
MKVTVIAPVYNEESCLSEFIRRISAVMDKAIQEDVSLKILFVNDGSTDKTKIILDSVAEKDDRFKVIHLATNFGHQSAVWCGLEEVDFTETVIVMDCDLQDPPEILPEIIKKSEPFDIVLTQRRTRIDNPWKKFTAGVYYRVLRHLSDGKVIDNSGDFYLLKPLARRNLLLYKENVKYIRGIIANIGFKSFTFEYDRDGRFAGDTHYTFTNMVKLAIAGVTGFSIKPLVYVSYVAVISASITFIGAMATFLLKLIHPEKFSPGIAAIILLLLVLGSVILTSLAVISVYIARVTIEVKKRPLYIISEKRNLT